MSATVAQLYATKIGGGWRVDTAGGQRYTLEYRPGRPEGRQWMGTLTTSTSRGGATARTLHATPAAVLAVWPAEVRATFRRSLRPHGLMR